MRLISRPYSTIARLYNAYFICRAVQAAHARMPPDRLSLSAAAPPYITAHPFEMYRAPSVAPNGTSTPAIGILDRRTKAGRCNWMALLHCVY